MDRPYIVYKNNIDKRGACSSDSDLAVYLNSTIQKFNHKYKKNISFYSTEKLEGELLKIARQIIYAELEDLLTNYHVDADPKGFGRSAMKVTLLGKDRILNHFSCKIDQIIYGLNGLLDLFDKTINENGNIIIYGLGDTDVLDWNLIWTAKKVLESENNCSLKRLEIEIGYIFRVDGLVEKTPSIFIDRLENLSKNGYLVIDNGTITVTEKGHVVDVWKNFITKTITIDKEKLKNVC